MNMMSRPLIQDLVKGAIAADGQRVKIAMEGARQLGLEDTQKTASSPEDESVSTDFAMKLAAAIEYVTPELVKAAAPDHGPLGLPEGVTMSNQKGSPPGPGQQGHGKHQPPLNPPMQAAHPGGPKNQLENTANHYVAGSQETALSGGHGKTASILAKLAGAKVAAFPTKDVNDGKVDDKKGGGIPNVSKAKSKHDAREIEEEKRDGDKKEKKASTPVDYFLASVKVAEDAINPARISAGKAVPPESSASGEAGGAPVAGMPQGPTSLIDSTEKAINYKKNQAHSPRKAELRQYFNEPALSSHTDTTLQQAFVHTGEAGTKFGSAQPTVKTAAARAILLKLAGQTAGKQA